MCPGLGVEWCEEMVCVGEVCDILGGMVSRREVGEGGFEVGVEVHG